jgi:hypothetical protein
MNNQKPKTTNSREQFSAVVLDVSWRSAPEKSGAYTHVPQKEQAGECRELSNARAFFAALAEKRKQPENCGRCGKPNANGKRRCDRCREYHARYKLRQKAKEKSWTVEECVGIVKQCRREVSKLREIIKKMQAVSRYKYNREYKRKSMLRKYMPEIQHEVAMDYLQQTNHAFEKDEI